LLLFASLSSLLPCVLGHGGFLKQRGVSVTVRWCGSADYKGRRELGSRLALRRVSKEETDTTLFFFFFFFSGRTLMRVLLERKRRWRARERGTGPTAVG
jgi:hypothetical protein